MTARAEENLVLVRDGVARAVVVTAAEPSAATIEAVDELNHWVRRITGTTLPVVSEDAWNGEGVFVAVGPSRLAESAGWSKGPYKQEEARVFIEPGRAGLLGNDREPEPGVRWTGTYYAVLEFVRREFGVRWIWPGESGEVFKTSATLSARPGSWTWAPDLTLIRSLRNAYTGSVGRLSERLMTQYFGIALANDAWAKLGAEQECWLRRERMNNSSSAEFGHAFSKWWDRYSKDHPDWFARPPEGITQTGGHGVKLNLANPEVSAKILADWESRWRTNPAAGKYLNVAPNDSRGFDTSPGTRAWDAPEVQALSDKEVFNGAEVVLTDRYVKFWNQLAIQARKVDPEAKVLTYAYRNYRKPPLGPERVEPNVIVAYVGGEGDYPDERFIVDEWGAWAGRGASLSWRPNLLNAGHGIPYSYSKQLYDDFDFFRRHGMLGTDFDSLMGNWAGQGLVYYVLAEQHSRPGASHEELAGEYYAAFGPAAGAIRAFSEYFERVTAGAPELLRRPGIVPRATWGGWWTGHIRILPLFLTEAVAERGSELLAEARRALAEDWAALPAHRERLAMVERGFEHARLMADTFRKLRLDDPTATVDYAKARGTLEPLWKARQGLWRDLALPAAWLTVQEQRQLGLWAGFLKEQRSARGPRVSVLDRDWLFRADPTAARNPESVASGAWSPVWTRMPWRRALPDATEAKVGWYRLTFEVPELADTGERVRLRFGSVDAETRLWINGVLVDERGYPHDGNYDSWKEPFDVDVTSAVKGGSKNELLLRVESERPNAGVTGSVSLLIGE